MLNPSWISAAISVLSVLAHFWLYTVRRQCERRMEAIESKMVREVQATKDWVLERFELKANAA